MRRATREARTLAISAHAAAVAARAVARIAPQTIWAGWSFGSAEHCAADQLEQEADRYWLRLARTMQGRG
jgi:hypothetical protein